MSFNIVVPSLGESISEVRIARLNKKVGDFVAKDELIGELETEKATVELSSEQAGYITALNVQEGDTLKVGEVVAVVNVSSQKATSKATTSAVEASNNPDTSKQTVGMPAAPSAAKLADKLSIDLNKVTGSGKRGQVLKEDVMQMMDIPTGQHESKSQEVTKMSPVSTKKHHESELEEVVRMSPIRKTIAKRLKLAQNTTAMLTTFNEIDMSTVINLRKKHQESFEQKYSVKLGFMSFFTKAAALALSEIPALNASISEDENEIVFKKYYHIGVAVGTDKGLFVPVLKHVENMSFADIEQQIKFFALKAKEGKLAIEDMQGGTFTISNGGIYGSMMSTPIINYPQSGILGLHNIIPRPMAVDNQVVIRPMMFAALSYDHRLVDGKEAVSFLARIKQLIEDPQRLLFNI